MRTPDVRNADAKCPAIRVKAVALAATNPPREDPMIHGLSVSDVARQLGANPKDISDLLYRRELRDDVCPIVAGRRLIPTDYLAEVEAALRRHGRLREKEASVR
jgi:hypothetical protein